jgi:hypothetical protein
VLTRRGHRPRTGSSDPRVQALVSAAKHPICSGRSAKAPREAAELFTWMLARHQRLTTSTFLVGRLLALSSGKTGSSGRPFLMDRRRMEPSTAVPSCRTSGLAWARPHAGPSRRLVRPTWQ